MMLDTYIASNHLAIAAADLIDCNRLAVPSISVSAALPQAATGPPNTAHASPCCWCPTQQQPVAYMHEPLLALQRVPLFGLFL